LINGGHDVVFSTAGAQVKLGGLKAIDLRAILNWRGFATTGNGEIAWQIWL
jgi:hypothetical protein